MTTSPLGLHRVIEPPGVLPQAAWRLDASPAIAPDEVRIRVDRLNLDAASYRQIREAYAGDPDQIRAAVRHIIATRGKMQNPVTGSGGMLTGTVAEAGPDSPLGLQPGQRVATLVSLTLTPLAITDGLTRWDGQSEQVPCAGHAILFARSIAAVLPDDLPAPLALAVLDVCGAPALTRRVVQKGAVVLVVGVGGKSGSLSAAAARQAGASKVIGVVPTETEAQLLRHPSATKDGGAEGIPRASENRQSRRRRAGSSPAPESPLADEIVIADARDPVGLGHAFEINPEVPDSFLLELAHAELIRELFPDAPLKYMPPTKHMTGNVFAGYLLDAFFNLAGVMTGQSILLIGMMTEGIHTPFLSDRDLALENVRYVRRAAGRLGASFRPEPDGFVAQRARQVLGEAIDLLQTIGSQGLLTAIGEGTFGVTRRPADGGRGLDGVVKQADGYYNPATELLQEAS
jgi:hypothetical protein